jgi:histone acetyltransferase (RNA polymerase elongator complex component)
MTRVTVPFFISHQGCPHTCVFCDQRAISGAEGHLPDTGEIVEKVHAWRRSAGDRPLEVAFFGGTFSALPHEAQERLLAPLQPLLRDGTVTAVRISTRPDSVDTDSVQWLAHHGVGTIELGVQSMDDGVLMAAGRGHDAAASEAAIRCVKAQGVRVGAQLLPGLPGDTPEIALCSLERVIAAGVDFVRLYPVVVLAGTELARRFLAGDYHPLGLDEGVALCKRLLLTAMRAGVDVVRIGLHEDEGLDSNTVLAGCRHPALGQLVRSELYFDLLCRLASGVGNAAPLAIRCHPSRISDCVGQKRGNLRRLGERWLSLKVKPDIHLSPEQVTLDYFHHCITGSIVT